MNVSNSYAVRSNRIAQFKFLAVFAAMSLWIWFLNSGAGFDLSSLTVTQTGRAIALSAIPASIALFEVGRRYGENWKVRGLQFVCGLVAAVIFWIIVGGFVDGYSIEMVQVVGFGATVKYGLPVVTLGIIVDWVASLASEE